MLTANRPLLRGATTSAPTLFTLQHLLFTTGACIEEKAPLERRRTRSKDSRASIPLSFSLLAPCTESTYPGNGRRGFWLLFGLHSHSTRGCCIWGLTKIGFPAVAATMRLVDSQCVNDAASWWGDGSSSLQLAGHLLRVRRGQRARGELTRCEGNQH